MELGVDEITDHLNARYVGAPEACCRLFQFPLYGCSHHVERLDVHLEGQHNVVSEEGNEKAAAEAAKNRSMKLTAWFKLNNESAEARQWSYMEIPEHYRWIDKNKTWVKRPSQAAAARVIGRMHAAEPSQQDRFYVYLLNAKASLFNYTAPS